MKSVVPFATQFDPEIALRYASQMSRPRRVGSGEEEAVARELADRLRSFGYQVEPQPFSFTNGVNAAIAAEVGFCLALIALAIWQKAFAPWAAVLILGLALFFEKLNRRVEAASISLPCQTPGVSKTLGVWQGRWQTTANIVATRPKADPSLPTLYLVAHYDSKSQRVPLLIRIAMFVVVLGGGVAFAVLTLVGVLMPPLQTAADLLGLMVIVVGIPLIFVVPDSDNESPGAIDNASGAGLVLHLAECLAGHQGLNVSVLITSAEEMAVMGAAAFVKQNEARLSEQARNGGLFILNFDGVGVAGELRYADSHNRVGRLTGLVKEIVNEWRRPLNRFGWVGVLFDHIPFAQHGFDAVTLITLGRASLSVHTSRDTADKLGVSGFAKAGEAALEVAERLAKTGAAQKIIA